MSARSTDNVPASRRPLAVAYRATGSLKPDPRNARTHSKRQVEQIAASIREFGFTNPVLIDPDGVLIAGHGRLLAAKLMGVPEVPTIERVGLSDAQKRALRLADNKIALNAGWDLDLLKVELTELSTLGLDMDLAVTGFSTGELDVLLSGNGDPDDDVIPPVPTTPRSQPGDIWVLGDHRVGCGDSRDLSFLHRVVGKGIQIDAAFLTQTLGAAAQVSRDGAVHFICMDWRHMDDVCAVGRGIYGDLLNLCVWNKSNAGMGSLYPSKHELVFVYKVGSARTSMRSSLAAMVATAQTSGTTLP
jgi:hypothetical protein